MLNKKIEVHGAGGILSWAIFKDFVVYHTYSCGSS